MCPASQHGVRGKAAVFIMAACSVARLSGVALRRPEVSQQGQGVHLGVFHHAGNENDSSSDSNTVRNRRGIIGGKEIPGINIPFHRYFQVRGCFERRSQGGALTVNDSGPVPFSSVRVEKRRDIR